VTPLRGAGTGSEYGREPFSTSLVIRPIAQGVGTRRTERNVKEPRIKR
jgi:hypothetical protein